MELVPSLLDIIILTRTSAASKTTFLVLRPASASLHVTSRDATGACHEKTRPAVRVDLGLGHWE